MRTLAALVIEHTRELVQRDARAVPRSSRRTTRSDTARDADVADRAGARDAALGELLNGIVRQLTAGGWRPGDVRAM